MSNNRIIGKSYVCGNCGAPLTFHAGNQSHATCIYCRSILKIKKDENVLVTRRIINKRPIAIRPPSNFNSYKKRNILAIILGCFAFFNYGISFVLALISFGMSIYADSKYRKKDYRKANINARSAFALGNISFTVSILTILFSLFLYIFIYKLYDLNIHK